MSNPRAETAEALIERLGLQPHPEGGFFRETFRSDLTVEVAQGSRAASTAIYFLLRAGSFSAWHTVLSDELWHFHLGAGLRLHLLDAQGHRAIELGTDLAGGQQLQAVVPAGVLQAAEPLGAYALVGCTVAPGFDFADFDMPRVEALLARWPEQERWVRAFCR